ncbi:MAG TPA: 30S ribosomal protein S15 [Candidatus Poseidoniales archaeon]|nr:MAG: 30S ribosomal protein S15 [Euryarchaeota archaeon]HIG03003.1 30S ribosomal protein S15 [Candidatus Poseidoniales archaeon]HIK79227.1 30S ribosomal protein S15 [Candidatus Poseidoniales archaeon]
MARMYAKRRGKSGSTKPHGQDLPEWSNTDKSAVEEIVLELHSAGHSTAMIGTILRDQHSVPDARRVLGQRIGQFIASSGKPGTYPEDMMNLMRKVVRLIEHLGINRKDLHNNRALVLTEAKIRRLAKYYVSEGTIPAGWQYKRDQVRLMVE